MPFVYLYHSISIDSILILLMIIINVNDNVENNFYFLLIALFHNCDVCSVPIANVCILRRTEGCNGKKIIVIKCNGFWD